MRESLAAAIAAHGIDVLLLGPVTRSGMNEAGTLQQVRDYTNLIRDVRVVSGRRVSFLLAHHENRGGAVSGAWEGAVDTLFHVQAQGHGQTRLFIQKARWSPAKAAQPRAFSSLAQPHSAQINSTSPGIRLIFEASQVRRKRPKRTWPRDRAAS